MFTNDDSVFLVPDETFPVSGGFARKIFVAHCEEANPAAAEEFLLKILAAAGINLTKDVLLASVPSLKPVSFLPLLKEKQPEQILVFGISPGQAGLAIDAALYQPVAFYGATWLFSEALSVLEPDKDKKARLWRAIQQIFLK
jgi:hypothetical protein